VPPFAIVVGNPARIVGYVHSGKSREEKVAQVTYEEHTVDIPVKNVRLINLPLVRDMRGSLSVAEIEKGLPFLPKRCFWIFDVPGKDVRGEHAHRTLEQFLVCVKGSCAVVVDDGQNRLEVVLDQPNRGLYIPPLVWGIQYKFTEDCVLIVFASDGYCNEEYIRDYDEFIALVEGK